MQRIPPSTQMREALTAQFQTGRAGHPPRQFVARAAELLLRVGLEEQVAACFGRGHYARGPAAQPGWWNGYGVHPLKTEAGPFALLPRLAQRELKPLLQQVFLAPDHRTALRLGKALLARFRDRYRSAMEGLAKDLEECCTYLLFPVEHRRRIRTTNLLERTFGESLRRTKVIPRFPGERACLTLLFAILITAAEKWRGVRMTPRILRALDALRPEEAPRKEQAVSNRKHG